MFGVCVGCHVVQISGLVQRVQQEFRTDSLFMLFCVTNQKHSGAFFFSSLEKLQPLRFSPLHRNKFVGFFAFTTQSSMKFVLNDLRISLIYLKIIFFV